LKSCQRKVDCARPVTETEQMRSLIKHNFEDVEAFAAALPPVGTLIGMDLGTKTIGLALSDRTRMIAAPLDTIRRTKQTIDLAALVAHATKHETVGFVLGYPVNLDGSKGPRVQATTAFARALALVTPLPILLYDERWSTVSAERAMLEGDASRAKRADKIDMVAAVIILQAAVERLGNLGSRKIRIE
jgi:putative holliday junction resolvase